jgi:hypothetical protein
MLAMDFVLVYWEGGQMGAPSAGPQVAADTLTGDRFRTTEEALARARELFDNSRISGMELYGPGGLLLDTRGFAVELGLSRRVRGVATSAA